MGEIFKNSIAYPNSFCVSSLISLLRDKSRSATAMGRSNQMKVGYSLGASR